MIDFRVCISQSERAARKANVLQMGTMYSVLGGVLLNLGLSLSIQGSRAAANGSFLGAGKWSLTLFITTFQIGCYLSRNDDYVAGVFFILLVRSLQKVKRLENFEKMIWYLFFYLHSIDLQHSSSPLFHLLLVFVKIYNFFFSFFLG